MPITIGRYQAEGPFTNTAQLKNASGIYVILTSPTSGTDWTVVDVGESHDVRARVENDHEREDCWKRHDKGILAVAAIYTPKAQQAGRKMIEQELRRQFNPPCGDR